MDSVHDFWVHAVWISFFNRENAHWDDINYFVEKYESILNLDEYSYELLYDQFHECKLVNENEIKLEEAIICQYDDGSKGYRMNTIWYMLNNLKSPVGNNSRFHFLVQAAQLILTTPHSNAGIEWVYSLVYKNKRQGTERNRLDIEGSLSSILAVKLDRPESTFACYNYRPDDSLLVSAKKSHSIVQRSSLQQNKIDIHERCYSLELSW